jgi:hypothetical protein
MRRWALLGLVAALVAPAAAGGATFTNPAPVGPGDNAPLLPHPSTIAVTGLPGTTVSIRATLNDVVAAAWNVDALLVGPGGSSLLTSDACNGTDFFHVNLTFDDAAAAPLGAGPCLGLTSGAYKPTNYDTTDVFPTVAAPYPLGLSNFRGVSPNGLWQLYVVDDQGPDASVIQGGWALEVTTTGAPAATTTKKKKCKRKHGTKSSAAKKRHCKKKKR